MNPPPLPSGAGAARPVALVALLSITALAAWWAWRAAERRGLEREMAPWAGLPLPARGSPVDGSLADLGARVFDARCAGCHHLSGEPRLGPNLAGVTLARDPEWLAAMILRPDSMTRDDPVARALLQAYGIPMQVAGGMDETATRAVIEFLRRADGGARGR